MRAVTSLIGMLLLAGIAHAHGLDLEADHIGAAIVVTAYYDDDTPAADATVRVEDASGGIVGEGRTDERGCWSFPTPPAGRYKIRVNAGDGHVARRTITVTAPDVPLSDGPTREEFTGPMRWVYSAVGLIAIAGLTFAVQALLRRRAAGQPSRHS